MYIYIIKNGEHYKIGRSKNVKSRLNQLQTSHSEQLEVIATYKSNYPDTDEKNLHEIFSPKNIRGEWYQLDHHDFKRIERYFKESSKKIKLPQREINRLRNLKNFKDTCEDELLAIYIKNLANKENKQYCKNQKEKNYVNERCNFYHDHYNLLSENHLEALTEILFTELSKRRIKAQFNEIQKSGKYIMKIEGEAIKTLILLDNRLNILKNSLSI